MITCPWCGTSYAAFQSTCQKCGGPIPAPPPAAQLRLEAVQVSIAPPPPAPRPISDSYVWKLLISDGVAIAAMVFLLLGVIFAITGIPLTLMVVTAFVGLPFAGLSVLFLAAGGFLFNQKYQKARTTMKVLRAGQAVPGQITSVDMNYNVQVNGRNPWTIQYAFQVAGNQFDGQVTTLKPPGPLLQPGSSAYVLYLPEDPGSNSLYPHP
jgi:hypothetical protein